MDIAATRALSILLPRGFSGGYIVYFSKGGKTVEKSRKSKNNTARRN